MREVNQCRGLVMSGSAMSTPYRVLRTIYLITAQERSRISKLRDTQNTKLGAYGKFVIRDIPRHIARQIIENVLLLQWPGVFTLTVSAVISKKERNLWDVLAHLLCLAKYITLFHACSCGVSSIHLCIDSLPAVRSYCVDEAPCKVSEEPRPSRRS